MEESSKMQCLNAWHNENQPSSSIHPNLMPQDAYGQETPTFSTAQETWDRGDIQMFNKLSPSYMCGYGRTYQ